jgi:hypothetical protein
MNVPYLIEAIVQPAKHSPYIKVAYVSNNPNVDYHMDNILQNEYYQVASVKSRPADEVTLGELGYDAQGNTKNIDGQPVLTVVGGTANAIGSDSVTEPDTGGDGPLAA